MKTAEIKKDTDYITGPSRNLWEGVGYSSTDYPEYVPHRMRHVRVIDARPHKQSTWSSGNTEPRLVEGEKVDRSFNKVGPLARLVDPAGKLGKDVFVVKPQDVRMEFDAWREEYARRSVAHRESRVRAAEQRREREAAEQVAERDRKQRVDHLNDLLAGSGLTAKVIGGNEVVLTGAPADLHDAAERIGASR